VKSIRIWNSCKAFLLLLVCAFLNACGGGEGSASNGATDPDDGVVAGLLAAPITEAQAVRFLWKSSFGPTTESIARLRQLGYARFVDEQLGKPAGQYNSTMLGFLKARTEANLSTYCGQFANENLNNCRNWTYYSHRAPSVAFFQSAIYDADQLRLRMAWALSQILVVSSNFPDHNASAMRIYQQLLRDGALGSYKDLLLKVSKNSLMGNWLDLANSKKTAPNQNYARELWQLFTVGTYQRKNDGSFILNSSAKRLETYTQDQVIAASRALTGWTYLAEPVYQSGEVINYASNLVPYNDFHDQSNKSILQGAPIRPGLLAEPEMTAIIDNAFFHPSTAPNIVRQLIQFLVTSNPSPAYIARVVKIWHNNGRGEVGHLASVARAILLDAEALSPPDRAGKLIEPVILLSGAARVIGVQTDGAMFDAAAAAMQQRPFTAPSVFNFYPPDYILPLQGARLQAPQFGILSLATASARTQSLYDIFFAANIPPDLTLPAQIATGTKLQWPESWKIMATNNPGNLIDFLNVRLAGGLLETNQRAYITAQVHNLPGNSVEDQVRRLQLACFLIFASPQFMVQR
jgi:uncharacterized protein (DUF1800 family)